MTHPKNSDVHALLRLSFVAFVAKVFETLHPGQKLEENWHIEAICYALTCVADGQVKRQMIHIPPRMLKSIIVSIAWPAFLLGHNPGMRIFVVSGNVDLATDLSNKFRKVLDQDWYKGAFPTMSGSPAKDNELTFETSKGGTRKAVSVNGSVTGKGADLIIIDDPIDASKIASQVLCDKVNNWIDTSLTTRLNHPTKSAIVLVMQRLSVHDPAAHLASQEPWQRLSLPARAEEDLVIPLNPKESYQFAQGDLLDATRLPQAFLDLQRSKMGEANFLAQYQQRPVPHGGGEIDIGLFQRYSDLPKPYDVRFLSVDAASGSQSGSYSVIQTWQMTDGNLYLVENQRGYWSFPDLKKRVAGAQSQFKANFIAIEKASSGYALLEELQHHYPREVRGTLLQPIQPKHSKEDRVAKAMVLVEEGRVYLPIDATWMQDLTTELGAFPAGLNDDQVDAFSQAVGFFRLLLRSRYNPHYKGGGRVIATW